MRDPIEADAVCAACSRLFKHLCPYYSEEFSSSLQRYLAEHCKVLPLGEVDPERMAQHKAKADRLRALYGDAVPAEVVDLYNVSFSNPHHAAAGKAARSVEKH